MESFYVNLEDLPVYEVFLAPVDLNGMATTCKNVSEVILIVHVLMWPGRSPLNIDKGSQARLITMICL